MQIIHSYSSAGAINKDQEISLYKLSRPALAQLDSAADYCLSIGDLLAISIAESNNSSITVLDSAGWYLTKSFNDVVVVESSDIARMFYPGAIIEYDIFTHRPTYISDDSVILAKTPWFLRYATISELVRFIELWCKSTLIVELTTNLIQHNYLKFKLIDLVRKQTKLQITPVTDSVWRIDK